MRSVVRSTVLLAIPAAVALLAGGGTSLATAAAPATSAAPAQVTAPVPAPGCVTHSASWRYTFVTNGCEGAQHLTVRYLDGGEVPCRTVAPGATATFPGYGTQGNQVVAVDLCPQDD
ncbi:alpha-amylase [Streptomyces sp. NPDC005805]|uniref:alpha-amylase n=1 Tax=Streptomyces sp. NPDC005805 TaxID=3157068 RepID=UPI003403228E